MDTLKKKILTYYGFYYNADDFCWHSILDDIRIRDDFVKDVNLHQLDDLIYSLKIQGRIHAKSV